MFLKHVLLRGAAIVRAPDEGGGEAAPAPAAPVSPAVPDTGSLTIEQATAALMNPQYEVLEDDGDDAPDLPPQEPAAEDDQPAADDAEQPEPVEAEAGEEGGEKPAEPVAALEAPAYWSRDAKATFAAMTPEQQAVVLEQEGPREQATAKAKADAQAAIQAADERGKGIQTLAEQLGTFLPEAIQTFQQRWGEPDWEATIRQYGAEQAAVLRARYDREQAQLGQLQQAATQAKAEAQNAYVQQEWKVLATLDPELAPDVNDPSKGGEKRQEVTKYLLGLGIGRDAVAQISALEMSLSRKAMLWDAAQAAAKAKPAGTTPKPAAAPPRPAARGGAAAGGSPAQRSVASAQNSFNAKPTLDNAIALLMARSGQG